MRRGRKCAKGNPMIDYEPLDLAAFANSGVELLNERAPNRKPAIGELSLRGLPFRVGADADQCFLAFSDERPDSVSIPVGKSARNVLFAHAILESRLHEGDPPGRVVARYRFVYADGEAVESPIRERFEIGVTPCDWGELPFLAVPETDDILMARYEGPWESTGFRQTEARQAWPQPYYLWCWRNARPA